MRRNAGYLALFSIGALMVLGYALHRAAATTAGSHQDISRPSTTAARRSEPGVQIPANCEQPDLTDLDHADCLLNVLIEASQPQSSRDEVAFPSPHVAGTVSPWFTKCDIGLDSSCSTSADWNLQIESTYQFFCGVPSGNGNFSFTNASPDLKRRVAKRHARQVILNSLEAPKQNLSPQPRRMGALLDTKAPQKPTVKIWASVLYNRQAACSVSRILRKDPHGLAGIFASLQTQHQPLTIDPIDPGAMIVKTIWQTILMNDPQSGLTFEVPVVDNSLYADQAVLNPAAEALNSEATWIEFGHDVLINTKLESGCPDEVGTDPNSPPQLPRSCFTLIDIKAHQNDLATAARGLIFANGIGAEQNDPRYIALVGINVMHLTPAYPNWRWSAFYWSKDVNPKIAKDRWKHFIASGVSIGRAQNVKSWTDQTVCFNPYLEAMAVSPQNGLVSNCLTCHGFAAFRPSPPRAEGLEPTRTTGSCLGSPDPNGVVGLAGSGCAQTAKQYSATSLNTRFLWSVGDMSPGSGQVPETPAPNPGPAHLHSDPAR